ncbi:mitochondrial 54S ribosomal protein bL28m [Colletotrichum truncatum]|uniref:50s ribosomal protein l24 n=1 Tax=Colletotrichum truncatum TaxID=5467 RepID=A0ACC3Z9A1_COLTU|nr:50s ribosomal protein l24 [Colletotrichum truncatum]KAF6793470.1 50s ribosomal protein l24 [Colletotrichum truncatum]
MRPNTLRPGSSLAAAFSSLTLSTYTSTSARSFSTSQKLATKTIPLPKIPTAPVPPYPYGPRIIYKQSNNGLYGTARVRRGHNVSEKHNQISARSWRPNVQRKKLWSDALGAWVRTKLTTRVLRTIRKEGGLDNYVTKNKAARVKDLGPGGWKLRWLVLQTPSFRERYLAERERLGVERPIPADNTDLVPFLVKAAIRGGLHKVSGLEVEEKAEQMMEEEFTLGDEAELDALVDDAFEEVHVPGLEDAAAQEKRI